VAEYAATDRFWSLQVSAPDSIDHAKAVCIGDFGLGSDSPIVLDYRENRDAPVVRYLRRSSAA
jgi:hypothetical protein